MRRISILLLQATLATACAPKEGASALKVTNGIEIGESTFPSVVRVDGAQGFCTGTFVSPSTLLTAAHCIYAGYQFYQGHGARSIFTFATPTKTQRDINEPWLDLAVIDYGENLAPAVSPLSQRDPTGGDGTTMVGYGDNNEINSTGHGVKRYGTNKVGFRVPSGFFVGMIVSEGLSRDSNTVARGESVLSGFGDSGGPVFLNGDKLAFIVSHGSAHKDSDEVPTGTLENRDFLLDLRTEPSLRIMRCAVQGGAVIPGIAAETNAAYCENGKSAPPLPADESLFAAIKADHDDKGLDVVVVANRADALTLCLGELQDCVAGAGTYRVEVRPSKEAVKDKATFRFNGVEIPAGGLVHLLTKRQDAVLMGMRTLRFDAK